MDDIQIQVFDPSSMERIIRAVQKIEQMFPGQAAESELFSQPVQFFNDSGETIPSFSMLRCMASVKQADTGQLYFVVSKPNNAKPSKYPILFSGLEYIDDQKLGTAQPGPVFRVKTTDPSATRVGPKTSGWDAQASSSGNYAVIGTDAILTDTLCVLFDPLVTPHFLFTLLEDMDSNPEANATIYTMEDVEVEDDEVQDPLGIFAELENGARGICVLQNGKYWILQAECP